MNQPSLNIAARPDLLARDLHPRREALRERLNDFRWRIRGNLALQGLRYTWCAAVGLAALAFFSDWWLRFGTSIRIFLALLGFAAVAYFAYRKLWRPLSVRLNDLDLAAILDRRRPGVGHQVANVLELPKLLEEKPSVSPILVHAAVVEHSEELRKVDWSDVFHEKRKRLAQGLLAGTLVLIVGWWILFPGAARLAFARWFGASSERWPQRTYLSLLGLGEGNSLIVPRGESLTLQVTSSPEFRWDEKRSRWFVPERGDALYLVGKSSKPPKSEEPDVVSIRYRAESDSTHLANFERFEDGLFKYEMASVTEPTLVTILGGDDWIGPIRIVPVDRPSAESLVIESLAPGASTWNSQPCNRAGDELQFFRDTKLRLRLVARQPLEEARIAAKAGNPPTFERESETDFVAAWTMESSLTMEMTLVDRQAKLESKPIYLTVGLREDRKPKLTLRSTGVGKRVTPNATIPLVVHADDDLGLASLKVDLEQVIPAGEKPEVRNHGFAVELPPANSHGELPTDVERQSNVVLRAYGTIPGSQVKIVATATDNCQQGTQSGVSRPLVFQVVTAEELFYEILMRQRAERAKFGVAVESAKTLNDELGVLVEAEKAGGASRKHQVVARQAWQVANRLETLLKEMQLNELGTPESHAMQDKIILSVRELHNGAIAAQRDRLEAIAADFENSSEKLVVARTAQAEIASEMEKLLAQMSFWESFVDVINQVKSVMKKEQGVQSATEEQNKAKTDDLFDDDEETGDEKGSGEKPPADNPPAEKPLSNAESPPKEVGSTQ